MHVRLSVLRFTYLILTNSAFQVGKRHPWERLRC